MRRILILDDDMAVLHALRRTLRAAFAQEGVVIEIFNESEAAVHRASEQNFDIVISDYRMPGLNGADVLQLVKGLQPDAIRIIVSATTEFIDIIDAVNRAEVFRYLAKPWGQDDLISTVREAFRRREDLFEARAAKPGLQSSDKQADEHVDEQRSTLYRLELLKLEQDEPGITHVDRDEHGNIRLS